MDHAAMNNRALPAITTDVLAIPGPEIPIVIRSLVRQRALSRLMQTIHNDMRSGDPVLTRQAKLALDKLGFAD